MAQEPYAESSQASFSHMPHSDGVGSSTGAQALGLSIVTGWQVSNPTQGYYSHVCYLQPDKKNQPGKRGLWSAFHHLYFLGDKSNTHTQLPSATRMTHYP